MARFGFNAEPVAVAAAIRAVLLALMAFGLHVTEQQLAAVMLAVELVLALVVRTQVTSDATMRAAGTSAAEVREVAADPYAELVPRKRRS